MFFDVRFRSQPEIATLLPPLQDQKVLGKELPNTIQFQNFDEERIFGKVAKEDDENNKRQSRIKRASRRASQLLNDIDFSSLGIQGDFPLIKYARKWLAKLNRNTVGVIDPMSKIWQSWKVSFSQKATVFWKEVCFLGQNTLTV